MTFFVVSSSKDGAFAMEFEKWKFLKQLERGGGGEWGRREEEVKRARVFREF